MGQNVTWILEDGVFSAEFSSALEYAVLLSKQSFMLWDPTRYSIGNPRFEGEKVVFLGSLENCGKLAAGKTSWVPGVLGDLNNFLCTSFYPKAKKWLLNSTYTVSTVAEICKNDIYRDLCLGTPSAVFIRPNSPLKPFSGRVVRCDEITPQALDHGFYYDDINLSVILSPVKRIGREFRFVVFGRKVVTGSEYLAESRTAVASSPFSEAWAYASEIASEIEAPASVYVLDVCESENGLKMVELNPFNGADLYACNLGAVVEAVNNVA